MHNYGRLHHKSLCKHGGTGSIQHECLPQSVNQPSPWKRNRWTIESTMYKADVQNEVQKKKHVIESIIFDLFFF